MMDRIKKLGGHARFAGRYEIAMYVSLFRWIARRPAVPHGSRRFTYHKLVTPVLALWIFASAAEIPLFHVITPWASVRILLLAISVWGLLWMLGYFASLRVYPHSASDTTLTVRSGALTRIDLPWEAIESVKQTRRDIEGRSARVEDETLLLPINGQVNVLVTLRAERDLRLPRRTVTATKVALWADDPKDLVAAAAPTAVTGRSRG
ncbi:hypothetical protein [Nocardioides speluncae]|uniref:hypothetical protein n=1 Tax=Nocardioides speluncae TaxID=2670337 RepID=UPI0012B17DF4|nr:hypothetical protein [Nocardioides speluncae]